MPKKTRTRFPKKTSKTFYLVRDISEATAAAAAAAPSATTPVTGGGEEYDRKKWELAEYGFADDGYNYSQHFKPMGSGGVFVAPDGTIAQSIPVLDPRIAAVKAEAPKIADASVAASSSAAIPPTATAAKTGDVVVAVSDAKESAKAAGFAPQETDDTEAQKEKYAPAEPESVDPDVAKALEENEEESGEKPGPMMKGKRTRPDEDEMPDDFVLRAMEGEEDEDDEELEDEDDDLPDLEGGRAATTAERRRTGTEEAEAMEEMFDEVMKGYEDEELGDLSGDDGTRGAVSVKDVLSLIQEDPSRILKKRQKQKVPLSTEAPMAEDTEKTLELLRMQQDHPETEVIDVPDQDEPDQKWDCQSVLSTYSTSTHIPAMLNDDAARKKKVIQLSKRTGVPLSVLSEHKKKEEGDEEKETEEEATPKQNLGERRPKGLTQEEKRARKKAIKEGRRAKRVQKKDLRLAYKTAETAQVKVVQAQSITAGAHTVIHY